MTDVLKKLKPGWNEIARQHKDGMTWQSSGKVTLDQARKLYDAGLVEMTTRRDKPGSEFVLQIKPRNKPDAERSPYFGTRRG
jgi:hypothetical protein